MYPDEIFLPYYSPNRFIRLWIVKSLNHPSVIELGGAIRQGKREYGLGKWHDDPAVVDVVERAPGLVMSLGTSGDWCRIT